MCLLQCRLSLILSSGRKDEGGKEDHGCFSVRPPFFPYSFVIFHSFSRPWLLNFQPPLEYKDVSYHYFGCHNHIISVFACLLLCHSQNRIKKEIKRTPTTSAHRLDRSIRLLTLLSLRQVIQQREDVSKLAVWSLSYAVCFCRAVFLCRLLSPQTCDWCPGP